MSILPVDDDERLGSPSRAEAARHGLDRRSLLAGAAAWLMAPAISACSGGATDDVPARRPRIATGNAGGVYVAYGEGIAAGMRNDLPDLRPEVVRTEASLENLRMVAGGRADVAFAVADAAADAVRGEGLFRESLPVVALARLYDNYAQVVVRDGAPFRTVADLAGQRLSTGSPASGTSLIAGRILEAAGLLPGRDVEAVPLDLEGSAAALAAGRIAAFFWSGGLPTAAVLKLVGTTDVRLLDLADVAATLAVAHDDVYVEATVPASAYGFGKPITTVSVSNFLVVRSDSDDELAYQMTRLLFTARDRIVEAHPEARRLNLRSAISTYPLELHPAAVRYYREAKD